MTDLRMRVWFGSTLPWRAHWMLAWAIFLKPLCTAGVLCVLRGAWQIVMLLLACVAYGAEQLVTLFVVRPVVGTWHLLRAVVTFCWTLFVGVHSRYSRMALVDAPLGMLATYVALRWTYGSAFLELAPWQQASFALLAGSVSFLLGVLNCEFVAKRVLGLRPA